MLPAPATDFYSTQQKVSAVTSAEVLRLWQRMGTNFDGSWRRIGPAILAVLIEAQAQMSNKATEYVPLVLAATGIPDEPVGQFATDSLVGVASDGRPLETLAYSAVTKAMQAVGQGHAPADALQSVDNWLDLMVRQQVADAARQATGVQLATRRQVSNYIRVLNPPSCQRCAILAGRVYRWSTGFLRHPRCDCIMLPAKQGAWAKAEGFITDPMDAFRRGEIRDLTDAQTKAINEGADIGKVVNAHRGMSTTVTRAATGVPTPEGIYQRASSRAGAIRLLEKYGYITT